ncbi:MAG: class I SAM-dependent RNA methyltransferase, partial [Gemmatimonadaceae bacterium]
AYAGSGATAIPLAHDGVTVVAIESDRDAVAYCAAHLPDGSRAVAARVEDVLARTLPADVVLINPPRVGIHEQVAAALETVAAAPRAVIYVSCDAATLARDLARMPRYRIASLRAFDMFPQTAHVETVCELVPEAA